MTLLNNQYLEIKKEVDEHVVLTVRHIVQQHVDLENKIDRDELLRIVFGKINSSTDRKLQMVVRELNSRGDPVTPDPVGGGYFWAVNDIDLYLDYIAREHNRALAILEKTARMIDAYGDKHGKIALAELKKRLANKGENPQQASLF